MYEKPFEQKNVICVCLLFSGVAFLVRHHLTAVLGSGNYLSFRFETPGTGSHGSLSFYFLLMVDAKSRRLQ